MAKPITFKASLGEIAFSEDYNAFTFEGKDSFFVFERA